MDFVMCGLFFCEPPLLATGNIYAIDRLSVRYVLCVERCVLSIGFDVFDRWFSAFAFSLSIPGRRFEFYVANIFRSLRAVICLWLRLCRPGWGSVHGPQCRNFRLHRLAQAPS